MTPLELWAALGGCGLGDLADNPPKTSPVPAHLSALMPDYCPTMGLEWCGEKGHWRVFDIQKFYNWARDTKLWTEKELADLEPLLVLELAGG